MLTTEARSSRLSQRERRAAAARCACNLGRMHHRLAAPTSRTHDPVEAQVSAFFHERRHLPRRFAADVEGVRELSLILSERQMVLRGGSHDDPHRQQVVLCERGHDVVERVLLA